MQGLVCIHGNRYHTAWMSKSFQPLAVLTFLVLEPELLLDLLAGKVYGAGELGAVQGLSNVVCAVLLDECQQLLSTALHV